MANKVLVLTLSALCNFDIIARHKRLGGGFSVVLPVRALAGRTTQAFGFVENGTTTWPNIHNISSLY